MPVPLSNFLPHVLPHAVGCPESLAQLFIRNAAIEFCDRTKIARVTLAAISLAVNDPDYVLVPPPNRVILMVTRATIDNQPLVPTSQNELDLQWPHRRDFWPQILWASDSPWTPWREYKEEVPSLYYTPTTTTIRLVGTPLAAKTNALSVEVAVKPLPTSLEVEDVLYNDWHESIADGALGRLLAMPEKPWQNNALAKYHLDRFESKLTEVEGRVSREHMRDDRAVLRTKAYYR